MFNYFSRCYCSFSAFSSLFLVCSSEQHQSSFKGRKYCRLRAAFVKFCRLHFLAAKINYSSIENIKSNV